MTREEFETKWQGMTPRERDAWVAEVMGIKIEKYGADWFFLADGSKKLYFHIPHYTEDISSAMEVAEKLNADFFQLTTEKSFNNNWVCMFNDVSYVGRTASEAICKAALISKVVE